MLCDVQISSNRQIQMDRTKVFDSNKYSSNSSKSCVLEVNFQYPKELLKITWYLLGPEKIEIKTEMLSNYQLKVAIRLLYFYW